MNEINSIEQIITPEVPNVIENGQLYVYIPLATIENPGIAKFSNENFEIVNNTVYVKLSSRAVNDEFGNNIKDTYQNKIVSSEEIVIDNVTNKLMLNNELSSKIARSIVTPISKPIEIKLIGVDTTNSQIMIGLGDEFFVEDDKLKIDNSNNSKIIVNGSEIATDYLEKLTVGDKTYKVQKFVSIELQLQEVD